MNISYEWLRDFVEIDETPEQLRGLLTSRTATVDEVAPLRAELAPIVIARVVEASRHPNADRLSVTKVDAGGDVLLDVVCGAPNVQAGKLYPFAPVGTVMPDGRRIDRAKIRGAVSEGMLCSARELGLGDNDEGILELEVDVRPGTPFLRAVPVGDARLVIDVGANRPDLLSHLGVAREVAAVTGRPFGLPDRGAAETSVPRPVRGYPASRTGRITVRVQDPQLARRYMGIVIRGLTVGPSPEWLTSRLAAVGVRPISNVVDATNYVLHELGQPMHAFDLAKVRGSEVLVRSARGGERLVTLDGIERTLQPSVPVIADERGALALAGIMGGAESEVTGATTDIFLEVASFDPQHTRAARRALALSTDASYRFERGVDAALAPVALERAVRLIAGLAGGAIEAAPADVYAGDPLPRPLVLRAARVAQVLGDDVSADAIAALLRPIGFSAEVEADGERLSVMPPSWRADVVGEIDLVEEVARLRGYETFPDELRAGRPTAVPDHPQWIVARRVREALVAAGLLEARPLPFVAGAERGGFVRVSNPLAENEAYLRREVLDTLARRAEHNLAHREGSVRLFEVGHVFRPGAGALPEEELCVGCLVMGYRSPIHFTAPKPELFDEWDAKYFGELTARAAYPGAAFELRPASGKPGGDLWDIVIDGAKKGVVRTVPVEAAASAGAAPAFGVELSLGVVESAPVAPPGQSAHSRDGEVWHPPRVARYRRLPVTPAAPFDLALQVPEERMANEVEAVIRRVAGELLESLILFDVYTGKGVESGHRSLAWRLTLRHPDRTLSSKEIDGRRAQILRALEAELAVRQRAT